MSQSLHPVDWPAALNGTRRYEPTHIIDLGPGAGVSALSAISLRGFGIKIIAGATEGGETLLASRLVSDIKTPRPYTEFLPKAVRRTDGKVVLENRFTAVTGRSPAILPGMTPTTVDARIIAAQLQSHLAAFRQLAGDFIEGVRGRGDQPLALHTGFGLFHDLHVEVGRGEAGGGGRGEGGGGGGPDNAGECV